VPPPRHKNVRRLNVAVDDPLGVGCIEGIGDFDGERERGIEVHRPALDRVLEGHAVQKLHYDVGLSVLLANVVNGADVGMIQRRGGLRFAPETAQGLRVFGYFVRQKLERNKAIQSRVLGLVHNAHAAATELLDNAVVGDGLPNHERRTYLW